jgi:hypothetical protein
MALAVAVFAIVDGVLFKPLPYPAASELHFVSVRRAEGRGSSLSAREIARLRAAVPDVGLAGLQKS